jgi:hypothetical protein
LAVFIGVVVAPFVARQKSWRRAIMAGPTGYPDVDERSDRPPTASPKVPLWVWLVGIPVIGTSLAMLLSMTVPLFFGGGMGGGGH